MKYVIVVVRTLLGLAFLVFGIQYFKPFLPFEQPSLPGPAMTFLQTIGPTGYMDVIKVIEISGGALLLFRLFVPLGLVLLTPVIVNIFLFETLLVRKPGIGVALLAMAVFLLWAYRPYFTSVFAINAKPAGCL